ncbi:hypothetical protein ACFVVU_26990 [Kitasatospora sp. NPDC057965]|uniref:hypothetical protein n=1 Tax=Kitasatospora sp. NPDC057965 TaxID=3346291 RepID=UPI0036D9513B
MQVHRSAWARNFVVLPNTLVQDRRLSMAARGLLADLLSRHDGWNEDGRRIADSGVDSRSAVAKALRELIKAGYYRVVKARGKDGRIYSEAHVYDTPYVPGLKAARVLLDAVEPEEAQVEPSLPRPASGGPGSGDAGVPVIKNPGKEPSPPAPDQGDQDDQGSLRRSAPPARRPEREGGRAKPSIEDLDAPLRTAALALYRALANQPRLRLGEAEVAELAPLVARWLDAGYGPAELAAALLPGLPSEIFSPVAVVRDRLVRKLPPAAPQTRPAREAQQHECTECRAPLSRPGLCGPCSGRPQPVVAVGSGERNTAAGAARARAMMRPTAQRLVAASV